MPNESGKKGALCALFCCHSKIAQARPIIAAKTHPQPAPHTPMTEHLLSAIENRTGYLTLNRPDARNALSFDMIREMMHILLGWRDDPNIRAVVIASSTPEAFCAGGDIRFLHRTGTATPRSGSAQLDDYLTEEYTLDHLIHHYPKPVIALLDGIVMGGGMGISQSGPASRMRIVTERTRMAMPEVKIGFFPDVGASWFLGQAPGRLGEWLGVTGETIVAEDALYAGLADVFIPSPALPDLMTLLREIDTAFSDDAIRTFAAKWVVDANPADSVLAAMQPLIDRHFAHNTVQDIAASLASEDSDFARETLSSMDRSSPLMMCVTLEQLRRGKTLSFADCLRMERSLARRCFEIGDVQEGIRALAVDKDHSPRWQSESLEDVSREMVERCFSEVWPAHAHPLRFMERF